MSDIDVQMEGIVTPTYDKRRKGYKFKQDGMEIFIKGEDKDAAMKQMSDLLDKEDSDDNEDSNSFAEGGMEDGGLKDEGGTVDPVSGNEVPSGSTQSEVRDDIPAQLSEGEFVLPADVVRYIGLENLMELRNKAKKGLAQMEDMGQMGNAEEAIMPDTAEMEVDIDAMIDEFDPNDPSTMSFAQGGVVKAQAGALVPGQMPAQQFSYGYQPPQQQMGYQPPQVPQTQFPDYTQFVSRPAQAAVGEERGITEQRQYIGPNGEMITIMFIDGKPQQEIPAGYKVYKPAEETPEVARPQVQQRTDGGDSFEDRQREAEERGRMEQEKELNNLLAKYDPEFAETWNADPFKTGKLTNPLMGVMATINTVGKRTDTIPGVLEQFGIPLSDFETEGVASYIPGNKYDIGKLNNTLKTADFLVESMGVDRSDIKDILSYTNLDRDNDGQIEKDDLVDSTGNLTLQGQQLFGFEGVDPVVEVAEQRAEQQAAFDRAEQTARDAGFEMKENQTYSPRDNDNDGGGGGGFADDSDPGGGSFGSPSGWD